jgi:ubiquinone/menaquinone biosynthesis C-methylase UbiE
MNIRYCALLLWVVGAAYAQTSTVAVAARYEQRHEHDPAGTGKFYLGREIAQVMDASGAPWLDRPERADEEQPELLMAALGLKGGETVADFGAGSGYYTFRLAQAVGPRGTVIAADIEPRMLALIRARAARERLIQIGLVQSTATDPKLPRNRMDLILLVDVYHELSHPYEIMRQLRAALKSDGRVVLVEYRAEDTAVPIKAVHKMSAAQAILEMSNAGFKHLETVATLPWQHVLIFGKAP